MEAAQRELREETGLMVTAFRWGEDYVETPVYGRGKVARYYLAEVSKVTVVLGMNPELGRPEHDEYRWVSFETAQTLLNDRVADVLRWARSKVEAH